MSRSLPTRMILSALVTLGLLSFTPAATAQVVDFSKFFNPNPAAPDTVTTLTFDLFNDTGQPVTDLAFTDNLPGGLRVSDALYVTNSCGGTVSAGAGGDTIALSGGALGAGEGCQIQVDVVGQAIDNADTSYENTTSALSYTLTATGTPGASPAATATLDVLVAYPRFDKTFADDLLRLGETTRLTFTIAAGTTQVGVMSFSDTLPSGLRVANPANAATTCMGGSTTLTATPGSQQITFSASPVPPASTPTLAAGASCTVAVDVTAVAVGEYINRSGILTSGSSTSANRNSGRATDDVTVVVDRLALVKEFVDDPVAPSDTVTLEFRISNLDRVETVTDISFTDDLDATLSGLTATGLPQADVCGSGSQLSGTSVLSLTGGTLASGETCVFQVTLQVPAGATLGSYPNTTSDITGTAGGDVVAGAPATDTLEVDALPVLTKTFLSDPVGAGDTVVMEFTLSNPNPDPVTGVSFSDDLGDFLGGASVQTFPSSPICNGTGSLTQLSSDRAEFTVGNIDLAAGASCTFQFTVLIGGGASGGEATNTTSTVTGTINGVIVNGRPASDTLTVVPAVTARKAFTPRRLVPGGTTTLEIVLSLSEDAPGAATDITFTDDLDVVDRGPDPDVFLALTPSGAFPQTDVCGAGSQLSYDPGTNVLTLTGGTLAPGDMCALTIPLDVPDTPADDRAYGRTFTNTTSTVDATVAGVPTSGTPASATVSLLPLEATKEFVDDPAVPGGQVTLRFTLENLGSVAITNIQFADDIDQSLSGLTVIGALPAMPCGPSSSLNYNVVNGVLTLANGELAAGASCTYDVTLQVPAGAPDGSYGNTTGNISYMRSGTAVTQPGVTDDLVVANPLLLEKEFVDDPVAGGEQVTLEFTLTNTDPDDAATALTFTDDLTTALAGLTVASIPDPNPCGGTLTGQGTTTLTFANGTVAAGTTCSFQVVLQVPADPDTSSPAVNETSQLTGTVDGAALTAPPATDELELLTVVLTKSFDGTAGAGTTVGLTFTLENTSGTDSFADLSFTDDLNAVLDGLVAVNTPLSNPCGAGSQLSGTSALSFSGGVLGPGATCTFGITLQVPADAMAGMYENNTSQVFEDGLPVGTSATDVLIVEPAPGFTKAFAPSAVGPGVPSTLTFTIDNTGSGTAATGLDFTDNLPTGLVVASTPNASTTCTGGTLTATAGSGTVSYTGGTVAAGATCTVSVDVVAAMVGTYVNTSGDLTSSLGNSGTASDTLVVEPSPLFSKVFAADVIAVGGTSTLTFTIDNTASGTAATGLDFTDDLPAGVVVAAAPNGSTTCTGGTLTATAGSGTISYTGGTVAAGATCTVSVDVTPTMEGTFVNTSGDLTSSLGNSGPATDTLMAEPAPLFSKAFSPDVIGSGGVSTLTFTIDNTAGDLAADNLDFTDNLPTGVLVAPTPNGSTTCTGGTLTATAGSGTISYTGGSVAAGATCTVSVDVTAATAGTYVNTSGDLTSSLGNSGPATDTLEVEPPPVFTKVFMPDVIGTNGVSTLVFTIDNSASVLAATDLDFTDELPPGVDLAATPNATTTCTGGTLTTSPPTAPDVPASISYSGGTVAAGDTCTVSVDVTAAISGTFDNVSGDLTSSLGNSGPAADTLAVGDAVTLRKLFNDPAQPGSLVELSFTLFNGLSSTATDLSFTDDLNAVLTGLVSVSPPQTDICGSGSQLSGTSVLTFTGGTLAPNESCTFGVVVRVPGDAPEGRYLNTTSQVTGTQGTEPVTGAAAEDFLDVVAIRFEKMVLQDQVQAGDELTLQFTITNPDPLRPVEDLTFTDNLDAFIPGATAVGLPQSDVCGAGSMVAGTSIITFTGGTVAPGGSCTFTVQVMVPNTTMDGAYTNVTSPLEGTVDGLPVTASVAPPATADVLVSADPLAIPTLSEWMLLLFALALSGAAVVRMRS